jgi:uncharacterized membrane protein YtjA (UPF0391 family)
MHAAPSLVQGGISEERVQDMLKWALVFLVIALIAGILGFSEVEFVSATIAQVLFVVFLFGFIIIVAVGFFLGSWFSSRR